MNLETPTEENKGKEEWSILKLGHIVNTLADQVEKLLEEYYSDQNLKFYEVDYKLNGADHSPLYSKIIWHFYETRELNVKYLLVPGDEKVWIVWT